MRRHFYFHPFHLPFSDVCAAHQFTSNTSTVQRLTIQSLSRGQEHTMTKLKTHRSARQYSQPSSLSATPVTSTTKFDGACASRLPSLSGTLTAVDEEHSTSLWKPAKNHQRRRGSICCYTRRFSSRKRPCLFVLALATLAVLLSTSWFHTTGNRRIAAIASADTKDLFKHILRPVSRFPSVDTVQKDHDPVQWLRDNSHRNGKPQAVMRHSRPKAAIISLVRNEELEGILQSMRQLELHWNRHYNYPWIFFNEKPFSDEFKASLILLRARYMPPPSSFSCSY
jgi:hypothetical protein